MIGDDGFISFQCGNCHTEIEASPDMQGSTAECPACGMKLTVPASAGNDGIKRHAADESSPVQNQAAKSRTIRIELGDL